MSVIGSNILAGASGAGGGYQISRSVRLRSSASAYFNRTLTTPTDAKKWTWSGWVKRGILGASPNLFWAWSGSGNEDQLMFSTDTLRFYVNGGTTGNIITSAVFRDPSAWYHIIAVYDSANATSNDRMILYVNGVRQTLSTNTQPTLNYFNQFNTAVSHSLGRNVPAATYFDGYLTEVNFIDGQALTPSSFGETNSVTGVWQPKKYAGTYGTNGFYLNFSDNSAATAAAIGKDYSGNGNNWTPNNISVTAGVTYDSMLDVPTQWADGGNGRGNYCTGNPLIMYNGGGGAPIVPKNGNLDLIGGAGWAMVGSTIAVSTGKWYWEATFFKPGSGDGTLGIHKTNTSLFQIVGYSGDPNGYGYSASGNKLNNTTGVAYGASYTNGDVIGVALDLDAGTLTFYKNNTSQGTAFSSLSGEFFPAFSSETAYFQANFGQRPFAYTPPSGFKALNTLNLPTPTILKGNQYFDVNTYTGTGATQSITNSGSMQPDFVWFKRRSSAENHWLVDAVRGVSNGLYSNLTNAEASQPSAVSSFNSNGFTVGADTTGFTNANGSTYVGWQWKEGATQGFDIVAFTGTGTNTTVAHNLGVAPAMMILKNRSVGATGWPVYHKNANASPASGGLRLNLTDGFVTYSPYWNNTAPTSSVFSLGTDNQVNGNGNNMIAYLFAEVAGFSKFGSYTGNGSADGPFVFCGFRPRYVMFKRSDSTGSWFIEDSSRGTYNVMGPELYAESAAAEATASRLDFLSNGFKLRAANAGDNANGGTYIFMAFAENPFKNSLAR